MENIDNIVSEDVQQENWKDRLIAEYSFVKEKQVKLGQALEAAMNGEEVSFNAPVELMLAQYHAMSSYCAILELRAAIAGIGDGQAEPEVTD